MKIGYADPPYPGQAKKRYGDHPDYNGEVDHAVLLSNLDRIYDGWCLHTSSVSLRDVLRTMDKVLRQPERVRIMSWVKSFAAFKPNVPVAYAWEPVLVKEARLPVVKEGMVYRDWHMEPITMQRGLPGAKPERVCTWLFEVMGCEPDDDFDDIFPGSGAVQRAWDNWCAQRPLPLQENWVQEAL